MFGLGEANRLLCLQLILLLLEVAELSLEIE